jgi:predicted nucleic acid-binding protein
MNFSSSLTDAQLALVIDASVLISIHSCTYGKEILSAIPNEIIVPKIVAAEFERGTEDKMFLPELVRAEIVAVHETNDDEDEIFEKLITTLDDGESATIAIAINRNFLPIIDERKGRAHAIALRSSLEPGWSLDLLRHSQVISTLGELKAIEALFLALRESHMRIPEERADQIIALIGSDRAKECTCLPGYRKRFGRL